MPYTKAHKTGSKSHSTRSMNNKTITVLIPFPRPNQQHLPSAPVRFFLQTVISLLTVLFSSSFFLSARHFCLRPSVIVCATGHSVHGRDLIGALQARPTMSPETHAKLTNANTNDKYSFAFSSRRAKFNNAGPGLIFIAINPV